MGKACTQMVRSLALSQAASLEGDKRKMHMDMRQHEKIPDAKSRKSSNLGRLCSER